MRPTWAITSGNQKWRWEIIDGRSWRIDLQSDGWFGTSQWGHKNHQTSCWMPATKHCASTHGQKPETNRCKWVILDCHWLPCFISRDGILYLHHSLWKKLSNRLFSGCHSGDPWRTAKIHGYDPTRSQYIGYTSARSQSMGKYHTSSDNEIQWRVISASIHGCIPW